ncbi:MAG: cytochrome c biogenesis protein ResB, partial [Deltaproteobacteria bacterium]|nr:cytochrome c biogenesis protein ResB [Deltaproteobacteria bacterium]
MTNEKPAAVSSAGGGGLSRSVLSRVWRFFNSLKLTLSILLGIAAVSIAGTVVEQGQPIETYITRYGERWGNLIINLQLNDMYHSPWFTVFLVLLVLNITVCTIERFPPKWKTLLKENKGFDPSIIERLANRDSFELSSPPAVVREKIIHRLKKKRYKIKVDDSSGGAYSVYAEKGIVGRFGSDVTHISLFLILTGTIIGSYWGFRDFSAIHLGSTVDVQGVDFKLRLDNFWIDFYDTGQIKQYNSVLTVVEGGKDVLKKQIWVNEPLYYKGVRFYQSSYGMAWNRIEE